MTMSASDSERNDLESLKFRLERSRYRTDILKWVVIAIGAVISFAVIDYGNLQLERFRVKADSQLLESYLKATESPQPDVWKRKLHILENFAAEERMQAWAQTELAYIERFAAQDALYRETLKVASQLVEPGLLNDPERIKARVRFNPLYWADLPYVRESSAVATAMVAFRNQLMAAELTPKEKQAWEILNARLIELSQALRDSTPNYPLQPTPPGGAAEGKR